MVVLYETHFEQSETVSRLVQLLADGHYPDIHRVYLFDNSHHAQTPTFTDKRFCYHFEGRNVGLAKAYNDVWHKTQASGLTWLMLLDQDTEITKDYLDAIVATLSAPIDEKIVALAPLIKDHAQQVSPVRSDTMRPLKAALPQAGVYHQDIMVINSATVVSVPFLAEIGGYNEEFALDYLDHWFSWKVFEESKVIKIITVNLKHSLSVLAGMKPEKRRYQSIYQAELTYFSKYNVQYLGIYKKQLGKRIVKYLFRFETWAILPIAIKNLVELLWKRGKGC